MDDGNRFSDIEKQLAALAERVAELEKHFEPGHDGTIAVDGRGLGFSN